MAAPTASTDAVLKPSIPIDSNTPEVSGIDFNAYKDRDITVAHLLSSMTNTGFQATSVAKAAQTINSMRSWRDPENSSSRTTIFLGYTSNLVSSGLRSTLKFLVQHNLVSAIVTTAGGVEEDLIKCLAPTFMAPDGFSSNGTKMREDGLNRIGNMMVPNNNYQRFQDWVIPIFNAMFAEQEATKHLPDDEGRVVWTPSSVIARLGREINHEDSICYQAYKNAIPVFSPALTDGSLGDMLHFHTFKTSPSYLDISITRDIRRINEIARRAKRAGMVILGGGLVKHHIANACLMRDGADYAVFINTAQEFDGSDAGARPDEAVSWGKIKSGDEGVAETVKVYAEATVVFPMIVAGSFAKSGQGDAGGWGPRAQLAEYWMREEEEEEEEEREAAFRRG